MGRPDFLEARVDTFSAGGNLARDAMGLEDNLGTEGSLGLDAIGLDLPFAPAEALGLDGKAPGNFTFFAPVFPPIVGSTGFEGERGGLSDEDINQGEQWVGDNQRKSPGPRCGVRSRQQNATGDEAEIAPPQPSKHKTKVTGLRQSRRWRQKIEAPTLATCTVYGPRERFPHAMVPIPAD